jgi:hypothetical protein
VQGVLWGCEGFDRAEEDSGQGGRISDGSGPADKEKDEGDLFFLAGATEDELAHAAKAGLWAKQQVLGSGGDGGGGFGGGRTRAWSPLAELCCRCKEFCVFFCLSRQTI